MEGKIFGILPRVGAIILAIILLAISAASIAVIRNNDILQDVLDVDRDELRGDLRDLQDLIVATRGAAGWLIFMSIGIAIIMTIAIILVIVNLQYTAKLVVGILEIIFCVLVILSYFGTGITCALYAAAWGGPPDLCDLDIPNEDDDYCDSKPLTATTALSAVFCFVQIGVFGVIIFVTAFGIMKSRSSAA